MTKSALAAALLALTGTALVVPAAAADPPLDPPTVAIEGGDLIASELQSFTVSDIHPSAAAVAVSFAGHAMDPLTIVEEPVGVLTATGEFETWGMTGEHDLVVAQCSDEAATICGGATTVTTTVQNVAPTPELSRIGTQFSAPFDVTVHLTHATGAPKIKLALDGAPLASVDPEDAAPIDTSPLADGPHQIGIEVCSADEARCAGVDPVEFSVIRTAPGTFSVSRLAFSPNDDGVADTVAFKYTRLSPWSLAAVEVRDAFGVPVFARSVPVPDAPATLRSVTYNGKSESGVVLPDGSYTAILSVSRTLDSGDIVTGSFTSAAFTVDTTAQAPTVKATFGTIYPYADGYRDSTKVVYSGGEPYSRVDLMVRNSSGSLVRSKRVWSPADATWNGRRNDGSRVREGQYYLRLRVVDKVGNARLSSRVPVTVNDAKVVWLPRSVTITPKASKVTEMVGNCSERRTPSVHGWAGSISYLSNTKCTKTFEDSRVWTLHKVQLPRAATYDKVRLGWYGGPTKAATHDRASASLYGTNNVALGWYSSLDTMAAQYIPSAKGSRVVKDGYVQWGFQTDRSNRYDVKSFTITYQAGVLR